MDLRAEAELGSNSWAPAPHLEQRSQSGSVPSVFTALLFFHTPRKKKKKKGIKICLKLTFQTHQLNMGEKHAREFSTVNLSPRCQARLVWEWGWVGERFTGRVK